MLAIVGESLSKTLVDTVPTLTVAFVGSLKLTVKLSNASASKSSIIATLKVAVVAPGANVKVPVPAV